MTKILYAEDIDFLRNGISADLANEPDFSVMACDLAHEVTLSKLRKTNPDVLLLDVMSSTNIHEGLLIARTLQDEPIRQQGKLKVLLLTIFRQDDEAIKEALEQGLADDVVTKPATSETIINKIRTITGN